MPQGRSRIALLLTVAALGTAAAGCSTDDAAQRDAEDLREQVDEGAGNVDERAREAGEDAAKEAEQAGEDAANEAEDAANGDDGG